MKAWTRKGLAVLLALCVGLLAGCSLVRLPHREDVNLEQVTTVVEEPFHSIRIEEISGDVVILPSEDGTCKVVAWDSEDLYHIIDVEGETLDIHLSSDTETSSWLDLIHWNKDYDGEMRLYLPEAEYETLKIDTVSGDVRIPSGYGFVDAELLTVSGNVELSANVSNDLEVTSVSGELRMQGVTGVSLTANTVSGDVELSNAQFSDLATIETTSGDVEFDGFDAGEIKIDSVSGEVEGTLLSGKRFEIDSASGEVIVPPDDPAGGLCRIDTISGDVRLKVQP